MKDTRVDKLSAPRAALLMLSFIILQSACQAIESREVESCSDDGALLYDSFDGDKDCGWQLYSGQGVEEVIADGVLRIEANQPGIIGWTVAGQEISDVVITTRTTQVQGPDDNAYGIICRYQNEDNYYVFLISGDGHYAIGKFQSGFDDIQYLTGGGMYAPSEMINIGNASNEIEASCIGNQLSISINGVGVDSISDPTFVIGDVGLGAGSFQPGTMIIEFEDFLAAEP